MVLRDSPVQWNDVQRPPLPDGSKPAGAFGTTIFYHSLTTMDYAGRALILRARPNPDSRGRGSMTGSRCGSPGITTHARWAALDGLRPSLPGLHLSRRCPPRRPAPRCGSAFPWGGQTQTALGRRVGHRSTAQLPQAAHPLGSPRGHPPRLPSLSLGCALICWRRLSSLPPWQLRISADGCASLRGSCPAAPSGLPFRSRLRLGRLWSGRFRSGRHRNSSLLLSVLCLPSGPGDVFQFVCGLLELLRGLPARLADDPSPTDSQVLVDLVGLGDGVWADTCEGTKRLRSSDLLDRSSELHVVTLPVHLRM
ncbi:UNVERIFIED_ORG: hypothetical protein FHR35_004472 [Microbispora rosea subsp. rosea]